MANPLTARPVFKDTSAERVAVIISALCDNKTIAGVIDGLLCTDGSPISDRPPRIVAGKLSCPECGSVNIICLD